MGQRGHPGSLVALAAALLLGAGPARADHLFSVAKFSYDESALRPALQLVQGVGGVEVALTGYPGDPKPGEETELQVSIRDSTGAVGGGNDVTCSLVRLGLFGKEAGLPCPSVESTSDEHSTFRAVFPREGNYEVTLDFPDARGRSTLSFPVTAGDPGRPWTVLGGFTLGCAGLMLTAGTMKRRRRAEAPA